MEYRYKMHGQRIAAIPIRVIEIFSTTASYLSVSLSFSYTHIHLLCVIIINYVDLHRSYNPHYCGIPIKTQFKVYLHLLHHICISIAHYIELKDKKCTHTQYFLVPSELLLYITKMTYGSRIYCQTFDILTFTINTFELRHEYYYYIIYFIDKNLLKYCSTPHPPPANENLSIRN